MKKSLFGSTALVLGLVAGTVAVQAHAVKAPMPSAKSLAPTLTIKGESSFNAFFFSNGKEARRFVDKGGETVGRGYGTMFTVDNSKLNFGISGTTDPGLNYGVNIVLTGDTGATKSVKENYLTLNGSWGTLRLGDTPGVEDKMAFGGWSILGATGGYDGNFDRVLSQTTGVYNTIDLVGDTGDATKAQYFTPRIAGFQLGVSFTPDTKHDGETALDTLNDPNGRAFDKSSLAGGLNYMQTFQNGLSLALSATGITGKVKSEEVPAREVTLTRKDTKAYALGGVIGYAGFELAGEWIDNRDSHAITGDSLGNTYNYGSTEAYNFGLAYTFGATKLSAGYYHSYRDAKYADSTAAGGVDGKAKNDVWTGSVDHKLAPGLVIYLEYAHYDMKNPNAAFEAEQFGQDNVADNKADIFILGTKVKF